VIVKFTKMNDEAKTPERGSQYAAGWDLTATSIKKEKDILSYGTSLNVQIPHGYFGIITARSSVYRTDLGLANGIGIIDSDYRGEIIFKYRILHKGDYPKIYNVGDRIGQIVILSHAVPEWFEAHILEATGRGDGGFGSTGK